ncbi:MAG: hypothetical protein AAB365_02675 [Patescibacteria group bacterium]
MEITGFFLELKPYSIALHAISAIVGMGAALASDVLFSFYGRDRSLDTQERKTLERLSRIIWIALAVIIVSGVALFISNPAGYSESAKFLSKMTIVGVLTVNGFVLARWIQPHMAQGGFLTSKKERQARTLAFACGAISLVSWCSAFSLGLLSGLTLSYITIISVYAGITTGAIVIALGIERLKFE